MKTKKFKIYSRISTCVGMILVVIIAILLFDTANVYATAGSSDSTGSTTESQNSSDSSTLADEDDIGQLQIHTGTGVDEATGDDSDGLSIYYNNSNGGLSGSLRILIVLTIIALAPSILIMLTSFTRVIIVLHFVRAAIGTQTSPPNQVLIGLALFITLFIMQPTFTEINENAIQPFDNGEITQEEAIELGSEPLREFMYAQTQTKDLDLFVDISGETYDSYDDVPFSILIPSFIISELRTAFIIGFLIYIPFIVIDMVVASVLMSMGMMMLPPTTISLPFKILLFILADGWNLVIGSLVKTFY